MPPLDNPRWEHFAQEIAKGKTAREAYVLAGYKKNDGNASRLKSNEKLTARVNELVERTAANAAAPIFRPHPWAGLALAAASRAVRQRLAGKMAGWRSRIGSPIAAKPSPSLAARSVPRRVGRRWLPQCIPARGVDRRGWGFIVRH